MGEVEIKVEQKEKDKEMEKWEVEDAMRTLIRAEEIKADKELMAKILPLMQKKKEAIDNTAKILYGNTMKG